MAIHRLALITIALTACEDTIITAPDAPNVVQIDAPPPPPTAFHYIVSKVTLPSSSSQARELGLDLNGDQTGDNELGLLIATLAGQGFVNPASADTAISRGEVLMLGEVLASSLADDPFARFTMYAGANPTPSPCLDVNDVVCGRHLQGSATLDIHPASAHDTPLRGTIASGVFTAEPGHLRVQLPIGEGIPTELNLIGARVKLDMLSDSSIGDTSLIAGGISLAEVHGVVIPTLTSNANTAAARDCILTQTPGCGCQSNTVGKAAIDLFDTSPQDCIITAQEVEQNALISSLLAPDIVVEGKQAVSVGFGIRASHATYTP